MKQMGQFDPGGFNSSGEAPAPGKKAAKQGGKTGGRRRGGAKNGVRTKLIPYITRNYRTGRDQIKIFERSGREIDGVGTVLA
jgi:hypothetical protein